MATGKIEEPHEFACLFADVRGSERVLLVALLLLLARDPPLLQVGALEPHLTTFSSIINTI